MIENSEESKILMNTYTMEEVDLAHFTPEMVKFVDIAHALSMLCRFGGHTRWFYSVGQHSINCALWLQDIGASPKIQLYGLLHDAAESYISDVITPIKHEFGRFCELEKTVQYAIYDRIQLDYPTPEEYTIVKHADNIMFDCEFWYLLKNCDPKFRPDNEIQNHVSRLSYQDPFSVESQFMTMLHDILKNYTNHSDFVEASVNS